MLRTDAIYITPDDRAFTSPDGIGRIFYGDYDEAYNNTGWEDIEYATEWESSADFDPYFSEADWLASYGLNPDDDPSLIFG
jgi:hypothetical protein